jgi:Uma2 family endonuclease
MLDLDELTVPLPDHTQLPESDGTFVKNFQEHPQSLLLTDSIVPWLDQLHPDGHYAIGQDSGIYWRQTDPPEHGSEAPDWFYVPGVPPLLDGMFRRSYVLWKEYIPPMVVLEFASGDGSQERDKTPLAQLNGRTKPGKFWVYEQILRAPYYGIYEAFNHKLEVYYLIEGSYRLMAPNQYGRYPLSRLGLELGLWEGAYPKTAQSTLWLRWWDTNNHLLLTGQEKAELESQRAEAESQRAEAESQRAEAESQRAEAESQRAEAESQRAERLAAYLRSQGIDPEQLPQG